MPLVDSVQFKNYRNFTDFEMKDLKRVNLIVGDSNVGKTGLLEGLVTLWGDEQQFKALPNTFRMNYGNDITTKENFWSWLYPEKNKSLSVELASHYIGSQDHEVHRVRFRDDFTRYKEYVTPEKITNAGSGRFNVVPAKVYEEYFHRDFLKINILPIGIGDYEKQKSLFNKVSLMKNGESQLIDSLSVIEPRLNGLRYLEAPPSTQPMVYADVGLDYKIPTTQFGHGFTRSMEMLSNLILSGSDIMIADEIENGIHYSALGSVWKAIIDYAVKNDVQVFATTHSRECIAAAHEAMEAQDNYELNVIRLQNRKGEVVAINHDEEDIKTAFDLNLPLR
ncbi:AAA family ATPase [Leucothrix arctica]|uniref:Uncharacterized protein n=1 Tax=Leucothrix arctica TaxID=1481894 RepID=A0A317CLY5_9GAMM|nr:AAA family ATPase [Leucothrix arctica]PWQ97322.1 hypothetical protein DKT75_07220 [Leucothrix arctica]